MWKNYLTVALRTLLRDKVYTAINVLGLAVGMAVCLLIGLYVQDELQYDDFHVHADRLFVVGGQSSQGDRGRTTPYPLATALQADLPEVQHAVRTWGGGTVTVHEAGAENYTSARILFADSSFFESFSFPLVQGNPARVLDAPDGAVLTTNTARRLFGDRNPIGRVITFRHFDRQYRMEVTGVAGETPANSTITFEMVVPLDAVPARFTTENGWGASMYDTYVLTAHDVPADTLTARVNQAVATQVGSEDEDNRPRSSFFAMPLSSLYLSDLYNTFGFKGQTRYLYIFGSVALFILLIAAINYINLVTAQAGQRVREVGMRKTMGAERWQLTQQFLGESVLLGSAALVMALALVAGALPVFNQLVDKTITLSLPAHGWALIGGSAFVFVVSVLAGGYPALVLAGFSPIRALRKEAATSMSRGGWLRRGLVVVQFAISAALIVGTAVIYLQLQYVQTKNLGFSGEQVVTMDLPTQNTRRLASDIRTKMLAHAGVHHATATSTVPGRFGVTMVLPSDQMSSQARTETEQIRFHPAAVDAGFIETLGLKLVAGRDFSADRPADVGQAFILNASAAKAMGWTPEEAIGKPLRIQQSEGAVIGVVADFHVHSLHEEISPVVLQMGKAAWWPGVPYRLLAAKLDSDNIPAAMEHLESVMAQYAPEEPFDYAFLDDRFDAMYRSEMRLQQIFTGFAGIAIILACLGLFGLAAFMTQRRTREIGIRKALGASATHIVGLVTKEFAVLVLLALGIGSPVAYWAMEHWLQDFAYRIDLGAAPFVITAVLALAIAAVSVSYHAARAALIDPVEAIRYE